MKSNPETITVPLSKVKMLISLLLAMGFVTLGVWLAFFNQEVLANTNPFLLQVLGWITILFFGIASVIILRKLMLPTNGLEINSDGITDNSSGISAGFIPWNIIVDVEEISVMNQKFISIQLNNPEEFIASQQNNFTKKAMTVNHQKFGSAVSISANNLKIKHQQLLNLLQSNLKKYKQFTQNN